MRDESLARRRWIGSFKLFGDFVEPGLDARLVDAGRAGDADSGNNVVAKFNRQPAGNGDDVNWLILPGLIAGTVVILAVWLW